MEVAAQALCGLAAWQVLYVALSSPLVLPKKALSTKEATVWRIKLVSAFLSRT